MTLRFIGFVLLWSATAVAGADRADPAPLNDQALAAHRQRNLGAASRFYAQLLKHEPPAGRPRDPLARGWPEKFPGDYGASVNFGVANDDALARLKKDSLVWVSRWPMATLNRHCLRYNFAVKTEWPWLAELKN